MYTYIYIYVYVYIYIFPRYVLYCDLRLVLPHLLVWLLIFAAFFLLRHLFAAGSCWSFHDGLAFVLLSINLLCICI